MSHLMSRRQAALALVAGSLGARTAAASPVALPAPVRDVVETLHGVTVHDPYRYLENTSDPQVQAWLKAQGAQARDTLDRISGHAQLQRRITEISAAGGDVVYGVVRMPGDRTFYMKRGRHERQFKLVMRSGAGGRERVLVDPELAAARTGVAHAINYFVPSWDGEHVAYGMSAGGSEEASLYILNVRSGQLVGAPIARVHESHVSWLPDSRSLTYNQLKPLTAEDPETEMYLDSRVMWLHLGDEECAGTRRVRADGHAPARARAAGGWRDPVHAGQPLDGGAHHRHHLAGRIAVHRAGERAGPGPGAMAQDRLIR